MSEAFETAERDPSSPGATPAGARQGKLAEEREELRKRLETTERARLDGMRQGCPGRWIRQPRAPATWVAAGNQGVAIEQ